MRRKQQMKKIFIYTLIVITTGCSDNEEILDCNIISETVEEYPNARLERKALKIVTSEQWRQSHKASKTEIPPPPPGTIAILREWNLKNLEEKGHQIDLEHMIETVTHHADDRRVTVWEDSCIDEKEAELIQVSRPIFNRSKTVKIVYVNERLMGWRLMYKLDNSSNWKLIEKEMMWII